MFVDDWRPLLWHPPMQQLPTLQGQGVGLAALPQQLPPWQAIGLEPRATRHATSCSGFGARQVATALTAASAGGAAVAAAQRSRRRRRNCIFSASDGARDRRPRVVLQAGPNAVELTTATVRLGREAILSEVDMALPRGSRAVVVGPNGCGKTTLLSVIAGDREIDAGDLSVDVRSIGWLKQEAVSGSTKTVLEEATSQMPAKAAEARVKQAESALAETDPANAVALEEAQSEYDDALGKFVGLGGYEMEQKAAKVLQGLSFSRPDFDRRISELSGGWQMRVALARALLSEPELLLLDEPTNHMDASAKRWLAGYLVDGLAPESTLMLVTHDRSLLEDIKCTSVVEIAEKRIMRYSCKGIRDWERSRGERIAMLKKQIQRLERSVKEDKEFVAKWGAKASHASLAQSRMKRAAKDEEELKELYAESRGLPTVTSGKVQQETPDGTLPLSTPGKVKLKLPDPPLAADPPAAGLLLSLKEVDVGYENAPVVINDVMLDLKVGSRVALLGPNGCGKTTLLRTLAGSLGLRSGIRKVGVGGLRKAKVALFTQDLAQDLPSDMTPVDYVLSDGAPATLDAKGARAALGALGLRGEVHLSKIGSLSGGEKGRVALAVFTTRPTDVLLLDEPTNHLDGAAVAALCQGLREHKGALLVASHDRAFVQELEVTATALVTRGQEGKPGTLTLSRGAPELEGWAVSLPPAAASAHEDNTVKEVARVPNSMPRSARQIEQQQRRIERQRKSLMSKIEKSEAELEAAETKMNESYSDENYAAYEKLRVKVEKLYEEWEEMEETVEA